MALNWKKRRNGSQFVVRNEAGKILAIVTEVNLNNPERRFYWTLDLAEFVEFPESLEDFIDLGHTDFFSALDAFGLICGIVSDGYAATLEGAKAAVEKNWPPLQQLEGLKAAINAVLTHKGKRGAAPNN